MKVGGMDLSFSGGYRSWLAGGLLALTATLISTLGVSGIAAAEKIALTFDDLPLNGSLPAGVTEVDIARDAVAILNERKLAPAYGFINAARLEGNPTGAQALKIWREGGQRVGNHTYTHMDLHQNDVETFERNLVQNEPVLALLAPAQEWRYFRYPYLREGETLEKRRTIRKYLKERDYQIAHVTVDFEDYLWNFAHPKCVERRDEQALDWMRITYMQAASDYIDLSRALARRLYGREISHVMLLHLGSFTKDRLPALLDLIKQKGFQVVTLQEAQSDPAYQVDPDVASRFGGSLFDLLMESRQIPYPQVKDKPREELKRICNPASG